MKKTPPLELEHKLELIFIFVSTSTSYKINIVYKNKSSKRFLLANKTGN